METQTISNNNPSYEILDLLHDDKFKIEFLSVLRQVNPNVDWNTELKTIVEGHKTDEQVIALLRSRSWVDQDIEPDYDYSGVFELLHSIFDPILLKNAIHQFNNVNVKDLNSIETQIKLRILDVNFKTLPQKLELELYIWRKCLEDYCQISHLAYEFVDSDKFKHIENAKCKELYRFNFGWASYSQWDVNPEDKYSINFIWNGINPASKNAKFLRDLLIAIYVLPEEINTETN